MLRFRRVVRQRASHILADESEVAVYIVHQTSLVLNNNVGVDESGGPRSRSLGMDRINSSLSLSPAFYVGMYAMQASQHTFDKIPLSST